MRNAVPTVAALALACGAALPQNPNAAAQNLEARPPRATVVLIHGMGGWSSIDGFDYFYQVPELWRSLGASVFVPGTTSFASIEERAGELEAQLDGLPGPLILVAHSQGGLDARYLVSTLGYARRVRALVTIASPHHGSPVADVALGLTPGPVWDAANALIGVLGWSLDGAKEITTSYMEQVFNPQTPDAPGVAYWSFSGRAAPFGIGAQNGWLHSPFMASWTLLDALGDDSDGIVPEKSAHWGQFLGSVPADHMGEVDQPLGYTPDFDARGFYTNLLARLGAEGW
ncbi:MAG TPA: alpha/beta fold hydrolase [Myxococcales bacterium]|nr:alpha/beta fold hydrolase [Myxococcales bacterium]